MGPTPVASARIHRNGRPQQSPVRAFLASHVKFSRAQSLASTHWTGASGLGLVMAAKPVHLRALRGWLRTGWGLRDRFLRRTGVRAIRGLGRGDEANARGRVKARNHRPRNHLPHDAAHVLFVHDRLTGPKTPSHPTRATESRTRAPYSGSAADLRCLG